MEFWLADGRSAAAAAEFFAAWIDPQHDGISGAELLCPDGARAAARRGQIVVAIDDDVIVGALRFYHRKRTDIVSLYQFAAAARFRGRGLVRGMLRHTGGATVEAACPCNAAFNRYYEKTGWTLTHSDALRNYWQLTL